MRFEKGHKSKGGRPKGVKNGEGKSSYSNLKMDTHNYQPKQWKKQIKNTFDPEEVDYYIYNDLDITELMDQKKLPAFEWSNGNKKKEYNLNYKAKKKRDEEGM